MILPFLPYHPCRPRLAPRALPAAARGAHPPAIASPEPAPLPPHPPLYAEIVARLAPAVVPAAAAPRARWAEQLVVGVARGARVIAVAEVEWIEAADNDVAVHAADGSGLLREPLKSLEARLDPARFARVHRSALVNLARVRELRPLPSGDYLLTIRSGARVTLSRTYRDAVLARLG